MIKIPTESQKCLDSLLAVKERIETFQIPDELNRYLSNINRSKIKERNINTIFSNLKNNMIFKFSDNKIKTQIKEILLGGNDFKVLDKGEIFKLYFYLYENELESEEITTLLKKYSKDNMIVTKESFIEFIVKESKELYTKWKFPIEIKIKYNVFEDVVKRLENPEILKKLSSIILELARYIDMKNVKKEMKNSIKIAMLDNLPKETKKFFKKYKRLDFEKAERIDNIIFIFLEKNTIISLTLKKKIVIELIDTNRYKRIIENEIKTKNQRLQEKTSTFEVKNYNELAKKLYDRGFDIKWIEINTISKVIVILLILGLIISSGIGLFYYFKFKKGLL